MPRNTLLAQVFHSGELLEKWGAGTSRTIALCRKHRIPEPEFTAYPGGFRVTFARELCTRERLPAWEFQKDN